MSSDLRKDWQNAKKKASSHVPKNFFNSENFGPKLDAAEKAYGDWEKEKDAEKETKAKKKAYDKGIDAHTAGAKYLKNVHSAVAANKDDKDMHKALYDLETTLSMKILKPLDDRNKRLKPR